MQLTTLRLVEAQAATANGALQPGADPDRDFLLYVEMNLKATLDRSDLISPLPTVRGVIGPDHVANAFRGFATDLRPEFEALTTFPLVLAGHALGSDPHRFINLWDIGQPNDIPKMMELLALQGDKSQLYGRLDYLVEKESQDLLRVFPRGLRRADKPANGEKLYYVILHQQPPTVELYRFKIYFSAYSTPMPNSVPKDVALDLLASTIANTGELNRIIQFWTLRIPFQHTQSDVKHWVANAFDRLPWRQTQFRPQPAEILEPTEWDVTRLELARPAPPGGSS